MADTTNDIRNKFMKIRFSESELNDLRSKANALDMTMASYIRQACDTANINVTLTYKKKDSELESIAYELNKIGVNINQIAHKLNSGDSFDYPLKTELESSLMELNKQLRNITTELENTT